MTKRMIDADALIANIKKNHASSMMSCFQSDMVMVSINTIKQEIQSLIEQQQSNTNVGQSIVGDRIVFDNTVSKYHGNCDINGPLYKHPYSDNDIRIVSVNDTYENVDATIRTLQAQIADLKAQLEGL